MEELSLLDIQSVSLRILSEIHRFCENNGILYSVTGGTLLGTIRHKGFIPWDDDVDVMMPRKDYEKFCRTFRSDYYELLSMHNDKTCMIAYARVCDMSETLVVNQAWTSKKVGIWVDVFPFDGAEDSFDAFKEHYMSMRKRWQTLYYNRALASGENSGNSAKLNLAIKIMNALHLGWINTAVARNKVRRINRDAQRLEFGSTGHVSQFAFLEPGVKEYFELSAFKETVEFPFENTKVRAICGYHHYLTHFYGNYMELPPIGHRVPKQDYLKFYWREVIMSREISVSEMKVMMMDIMSSIDEFCRLNGLRYTLAYGTLIGAVRHKGYIPWDDDIDIWMPRPDYIRFMKEFRHPYYSAYCAEFTPGWDHFIAKVCDDRTVIDEGHGDTCGVFVDVFPVDGWPDGDGAVRKHYASVMRRLRMWSSLHYTKGLKFGRSNGLSKNLKIAASRVLGLFFNSEFALKRMLEAKTKYRYEDSDFVGSLTCGDWAVPQDVFNDLIEADFEDRKYQISARYDELLRAVFGDYMQLPPEEERVSNHGYSVYWK